MSPRKGYYLKPAGRTTSPGRLYSIIVVPKQVDTVSDMNGITQSVWGRAHVAYSTRRRGVWTPTQNITFGTPEGMWTWLEDTGRGRGSMYITAPIASDVLTLAMWWGRLDALGAIWCGHDSCGATTADGHTAATAYQLQRLVLRGSPDIIQYLRLGRKYTWVSGTQLFPIHEDELARSLGFKWSHTADDTGQHVASSRDPMDRASLYLCAMQSVCDWWVSIDGGPWGHTLGQLAMRHLRSRIPERCVCTHNDDDVKRLERSAGFGGRMTAWYQGDVSEGMPFRVDHFSRPVQRVAEPLVSPVFAVDVRSMYPYILSTKRMPIRLVSHVHNPTTQDVSDWLQTMCVVASVSIDTRRDEYPVRLGSNVVYPTGRFVTVLCADELATAIARRDVVHIHDAAVYQSGNAFQLSAMEMLSVRRKARSDAVPHLELLAKLVGNALTGKFAQRPGRWCPFLGTLPHVRHDAGQHGTGGGTHVGGTLGIPRWGEFIVARLRRPDTTDARAGIYNQGAEAPGQQAPASTRFRAIAGLLFALDTAAVGTGTLMAVYAHITSYARDHMRQLREMCPPRSVLLQDTDGLWLTTDGMDAIKGYAPGWGDEPGQLRITHVIQEASIFGPKHYWRDGCWTLSGISNPQRRGAGITFTATQTANPVHSGATSPPMSITHRSYITHLHFGLHQGRVGADGWMIPVRLPLPIRSSS